MKSSKNQSWLLPATDGSLYRIFVSLASLRLTVTLFALSIFIILVGTLAQTQKNMWDVRADYFHCWWSWIELRVFFPAAWFPEWQQVRGGFPFPGGKLIGVAMAVNLLAAHLFRFKVQAKGRSLIVGTLLLLVGTIFVYLVVSGGGLDNQTKSGQQTDWGSVWLFFKWILFALAVTGLGAVVYYAKQGHYRLPLFWILSTPVLLSATVVFWVLVSGKEAYLGDAGMRILWQLMLAEGASLVCLAGCLLVFKRRGGVVLLHAGLALIMFGELMVDLYAVESRVTLAEGETAMFASDSRTSELAIVDRSGENTDEEVVVPESMLRGSQEIQHPFLPFDIVPVRYYSNTQMSQQPDSMGRRGMMLPTVKELGKDFKNPADRGAGQVYAALEAAKTSGTDAQQTEDIPAAYVEFRDKDTPQSLGTYLITSLLKDQAVEIGGKKYDVALRYKRIHKPFSLRLDEVRKDDYLGTNIPQNYSSQIRLRDPVRNVDRSVKIWMNNPLRYAGETYYQSGYNELGGKKYTTLAVVTNMGWMIPYVGCMLVATGLLAHFSITLTRFLKRQASVTTVTNGDLELHRMHSKWSMVVFPSIVLLFGLGWIATRAVPRSEKSDEPHVEAFAALPLIYQGRVKPFDTVAINSLRIISEKATFKDLAGKSQPAQRWLLETIAHTPDSMDFRIFRIENFDLLHTLGLTRRKGFRYAYNELAPKLDAFKRQVALARKAGSKNASLYQKKVLELNDKIELFLALREAHRLPDRTGPNAELRALTMAGVAAELANSKAPRAIPSPSSQRQWEPLSTTLTANWVRDIAKQRDIDSTDKLAAQIAEDVFSEEYIEQLVQSQIMRFIEQIVQTQNPNLSSSEMREYVQRAAANLPEEMRKSLEPTARQEVMSGRKRVETELANSLRTVNGGADLNRPRNELADQMAVVLTAYKSGDATAFNEAVFNYQTAIDAEKPEALTKKPSWTHRGVERFFGSFYGFESRFNQFDPFTLASVFYLVAFVFGVLGLLIWRAPLQRAALWLMLLAFAVQTIAILARIYISGRPPVTNLYSSAVFIGWGCVLLAIVLEWIYRMGIGTILGTVVGFLTLRVAFGLAADGDTFVVLQAVLDTQFWLATHVVAITLGYSTTFLAGGLGILYILFLLGSRFGATFPNNARDALPRMIYGVLCFAIFFSFVGTVLGGLWADDSWGRFWGWDPKENGALMIVLWNALILHARWAGLIRARGIAVLAVAGNIVTAWSWFGVNELGVGLHSYGFTEGVLVNLTWFVLSQLLIIGIGCLPLEKSTKAPHAPVG
ncbi:MAG: cytochrome c biogenesis protein CcsA [Planctomycetota bacterium]|nr:cytochrome c biogenesis protein CcsA [Planctomycetota bacterium]